MKAAFYGRYSTDHQGGNTLLVRRVLVEEKLFAAIKDLFPPRHMKRAIKEAMQLLGELCKAKRLDLDAAKQALKKTQQDIANLVGAIKAGAFSAALKAELAGAEAERARLQAVLDIDHDEAVNVTAFLRQAVSRHKVLTADIAGLAMRDVARARAQLRTLVGGRVPLRPNATREFLIAELSGHYAGLATLTARKISVDLH